MVPFGLSQNREGANIESAGFAGQFWGMAYHKHGSPTKHAKVLPVLAVAVAAVAANAPVGGSCLFRFAAACCMFWCFGEHAGGKCDSGSCQLRDWWHWRPVQTARPASLMIGSCFFLSFFSLRKGQAGVVCPLCVCARAHTHTPRLVHFSPWGQ